MFWADKIAKDIIDSKQYKPYWVNDMFTPSGFAHIGSLRGPLVHDAAYRALKTAHEKVEFTYVFNDFDPIDGLPPELVEKSGKYLGFPLRSAPSPEQGFKSFEEYFTEDFKKVLKSLGLGAKFLSSWDMYHEGKFDEVIRIALDNAEKIQDIYQKVSGSQKREKGWLPLQVICEKCGKLGTTRVHGWDGKMVSYTCEESMVTWAKGCRYTGKISPFGGVGKLPWKVDWPAHWKVLGVTIEGAGKDHSSAGGSRDIAKELCKEVFHIPNPYNLPYEFFLIGGKKMSSSKGLGLKARDLTSILPPEIGRFLFTRTDYNQAIEFNPVGTMAICDLFDEYDRCWKAYTENSDENLSRAFIYAQIDEIPEKEKIFLPRFRDIANVIQNPTTGVLQYFTGIKESPLNPKEKEILEERIRYAKVWLKNYAPSEMVMEMSRKIPEEAKNLSDNQKKYLKEVIRLLSFRHPALVRNDTLASDLQIKLYEAAKKLSISPKDAFSSIYISTIGKPFGPKAGVFLSQYPKDVLIKRFETVINGKKDSKSEKNNNSKNISHLFSIHPDVKKIFPSISAGVAVIKGVSISKSNPHLEKEKENVLKSLEELTPEKLGLYPEVISYRKLYKQMGVDWHSRRPSPEALLRRVVLGKGIYSINTCVDAYNLIVMRHRVSIGAFDYDKIKFPTILRFAKENDEILLLGEKESTKYFKKELAYYDSMGGYNIDFNYRDAQRTAVSENTKNLLINVDGVYDIAPEKVKEILQESVKIILKYCGGEVAICE
ncbi:lysine--tRNA ligase [Candidatus Gottesmanbacteria bacterium RIFCSPHIGHO2_02_FULL_39_11]|uniref:Lysine--tRNA ligase n=1 Tax=Candidatus Gottesmanbacteria bacterium RIFCSPHIGHO2_02_FULL_39_11 TaxID=1798382 RepID=A0A1F5ZX51_9BACT|nr:MAG: lysine--tRNA ligase [Candidatus Gottesmanbacteria bacterium RIFCSPHIGHO2_02_FULL_39_11]